MRIFDIYDKEAKKFFTTTMNAQKGKINFLSKIFKYLIGKIKYLSNYVLTRLVNFLGKWT